MVALSEHKTVQARILAYAQEIGLRFVPRAEAEARRGFEFQPVPDPFLPGAWGTNRTHDAHGRGNGSEVK